MFLASSCNSSTWSRPSAQGWANRLSGGYLACGARGCAFPTRSARPPRVLGAAKLTLQWAIRCCAAHPRFRLDSTEMTSHQRLRGRPARMDSNCRLQGLAMLNSYRSAWANVSRLLSEWAQIGDGWHQQCRSRLRDGLGRRARQHRRLPREQHGGRGYREASLTLILSDRGR